MSDEYLEHGELNTALSIKKLKYLVVGTGRCGTVYLAKLLSSLGVHCGHETIFDYHGIDKAIERLRGEELLRVSKISKMASKIEETQGVKWFNGAKEVIAESSYMAAPYLDHPCLKDTTIIHIVREPMKVINSFVVGLDYFSGTSKSYLNDYHEFIYKYVPRLYEDMAQVSRAALYYIKWNEMIEQKSKGKNYFFYRIESKPATLFNFIGINPPKTFYHNKRSNHKEGIQDVYNRFDQIPDKEIRERLQLIRQRYYNIPLI